MAGEGGTRIILILFIFGGLLHHTDSTSCVPLTDNTCHESEESEGTCGSDSVCVCKPGYAPSDYGCRDDPPFQSEVHIDFNGEAETGATFDIGCPYDGNTPFTMVKGQAIMESGSTNPLQIVDAQSTNEGSYRCEHSDGDWTSEQSEAVDIRVVAIADFEIKPIVTNVPKKAAKDMKVTAHCTNFAKTKTDGTFEWKLNDLVQSDQTGKDYALTFTDGTQGQTLTCAYGGIVSEVVRLPDQFSDTISGVEVIGHHQAFPGFPVELNCQFTDDYPKFDESESTTYSWYKDDEPMANQAERTLVLPSVSDTDSASYQCGAKFKETEIKMSPGFELTVDQFLGDVTCLTSAEEMLKTGYLGMKAEYKVKNSEVGKQTKIVWWHDDKPLVGMSGEVIEINNPGGDLDGTYSFKLSTDFQENAADAECITITAKESSQISTTEPTLEELSGHTVYLIDIEYKFLCESDFYTPGGKYKWYVGTADQVDDDNVFSYTPTDDSDVTIGCEFTFESETSQRKEIVVKGAWVGELIIGNGWLHTPSSVDLAFINVPCTAPISPRLGTGDVTFPWVHGSITASIRTSHCEAKKGVTTIASSEEITEKVDVGRPVVPIVTSNGFTNEDEVIAVEGDEVTLYCLSQSYKASEATFQWKKGNDDLSDETGFTKTIASMTMEDAGSYTCKITVYDENGVPIDSDFSTNAKVVTFTDLPQCVWASDCDRPNFNRDICLHGKCQCLEDHELKAGKCVPIPQCDFNWDMIVERQACVKVIRKKKSFSRAQAYCKKRHGDLATSVTSREHRARVTSQVKHRTQFWIGVHSPDQNEIFQYVDGTAVETNAPFKGGPPKATIKNFCVSMKKRAWVLKNCRRRHPFACEKLPNHHVA